MNDNQYESGFQKNFSKKPLCHMLCLHLYNNLQNDGLNVLNQVIISTGMNILCLLMDYNSLIYWITTRLFIGLQSAHPKKKKSEKMYKKKLF